MTRISTIGYIYILLPTSNYHLSRSVMDPNRNMKSGFVQVNFFKYALQQKVASHLGLFQSTLYDHNVRLRKTNVHAVSQS